MHTKRFVEGVDRNQGTLLRCHLDDFVAEDDPIRVVDVFVDHVDLGKLGFDGVNPLATGRPSYQFSVLLKIYIYGYRQLNLFSRAIAGIDGSKFKAVNNRHRNFTTAKAKRRMEQIEESIDRHLKAMDTADREAPEVAEARTARLKDKIAGLKEQMQRLKNLEARLDETPDHQISLTDPDARSMATSGRGSGIVGYNLQAAVDAEHHLIVAHEVTNVGTDRDQLSTMANQARDAMGTEKLTAVADRGYFKGEEIVACEQADITTYRHDQGVDGSDPLPDQDSGPGQHRNEPSRPGVRPQARHESARHRRTDRSNPGVSPADRNPARISARFRPVAAALRPGAENDPANPRIGPVI